MNIPRLTAARLLVPLALFIPNVCLGQEVPQLTVGRLSGDARVFGTNPFGIEYDGQVMGEGQSGRFNTNWDADWTVRAQMTERGWARQQGHVALGHVFE